MSFKAKCGAAGNPAKCKEHAAKAMRETGAIKPVKVTRRQLREDLLVAVRPSCPGPRLVS